MKDLSIEKFEVLLCSTGYLPPRTEEELLFFNEMYADYKPRIANRHVDVNAIISNTCCVIENKKYEYHSSEIISSFVAEDNEVPYFMAARNFEKLPKYVLDKMRGQHKSKGDEDE